MKKITLLTLAIVFISLNANSQETLVASYNSGDLKIEFNQQSTTIISSNAQTRDIVSTFDNRLDFDDACDGTLVLEDFAGGPGGVQACGPVISSAGDGCFAAGEIVDGIEITFGGGAGTDTVYAPAGGFGNPDPIAGSNTFVDFTIINFTEAGVNAVGMDIYPLLDGGDVQVRIFGNGGLIDTFTASVGFGGFFGVIADEDIVSIEIEDLTGANAELIGMLEFGTCTILSTTDNLLSNISLYPIPSDGTINIKVPSSLQIIDVELFDLQGRNTGAVYSNGTVNVSNLSRGVYMITIKTSEGTLTQKVVKK